MARLGVVEGTVIGARAMEHGYYLLIRPPTSPLEVFEPKPMWVGVSREVYAKARKGDPFVLGGERA